MRVLARPPRGSQPSQTEKTSFSSRPGEEDGGGVGEDREDAEDHVGPAVAEVRGEHAERNADEQSDDERVEDELDSGATVGAAGCR